MGDFHAGRWLPPLLEGSLLTLEAVLLRIVQLAQVYLEWGFGVYHTVIVLIPKPSTGFDI